MLGIKTDVPGLQFHYYEHAHHDVTVDLPRELGERQRMGKSHQPGYLRRREAPQVFKGR